MSSTSTKKKETDPNGVDHVVLLKLKSDAAPAKIDEMTEQVQSLICLPFVQSVSIGPIFVEQEWMSDRTQGFTYSLHVRLDSKESLRLYQDCDLHVKVATEYIKPLLDGPPIAVDWVSPVVTKG